MKRDTLIQVGSVGAMAACLALSGTVATRLTASAGRHKLGYVLRAEENDPPEVSLGIAMGAFRGLFVNFLWIRANKMKEEGRYYEAVELARNITRLQPRFPAVWAFHAWNLAYNISVTTQTLEERWNWVNAGIRLLRDQGVVYNPTDLVVHKELGWIFLHKITAYMDDANNYYKRRLALEWHELLGPPPPVAGRETRAQAIERHVEWLRPIDEAPDRLEDLIKAEPSVGDLVARLRPALFDRLDVELLQRYQRNDALRGAFQRSAIEQHLGPVTAAMMRLMDDPAYAKAWPRLLAHVRRRVLIDDYHMEPARMIRYTRKYGPIDWRHGAAHGIYWVQRGIEGALGRVELANRQDFDFLNTDRIVIHSVQELGRSGDLYFDYFNAVVQPEAPGAPYVALPNPHFIESYIDILDEMRARGGIFENPEERIWTNLAQGFENFMKDSIRFIYRRGDKAEATKWKDYMGALPWANANDPMRAEYFAQGIDEFVQAELQERLTSPYVATQEVTGALIGAFTGGLVPGDMQAFQDQWSYARLVHSFYMTEQSKQTLVSGETTRMAQMPTDFRFMAGVVFANFVATLKREEAERVYSAAPEELRLFAYDPLATQLRGFYDAEDEAAGNPPGTAYARAYPEPPGLEQHRIEIAERLRREAEQRPDVQRR